MIYQTVLYKLIDCKGKQFQNSTLEINLPCKILPLII